MTVLDLMPVEVGQETTWGDASTPTAKVMGLRDFTFRPKTEAIKSEDRRGSLAPAHTSEIAKVSAEGGFEQDLLYEDIHYWLESICGEATPSGAGPFTYAGSAPGSSAPASPRLMNFVQGEGSDVWGMAGSIVDELTIAISSNEMGSVSGSLLGKQVNEEALVGLADRAINTIMGDHVSIYIDAWGGTIGTTQIPNTAFAVELTLRANRMLKHHLGALTADGHAMHKWEGTLSLVLELNATTNPFLDTIAGGSSLFQKQVRIACASGGGETLDLDFAGYTEDGPEFPTEEDGIVTVELELAGKYNSALGNWFAYSGDNDLSALP